MALKKYKKNKYKDKGYAILFAIIIISAISAITAGLVTIAYKQLVLSSLASDSQIAFYQADKGTECALYLDRVLNYLDSFETNFDWTCGEVPLYINPYDSIYIIKPKSISISKPCFNVTIDKSLESTTKITSEGYNLCPPNNIRALERTIEIIYKDEY